MKFTYSVSVIDPGDAPVVLEDYQYWLIIDGEGELFSQDFACSFTSQDVLELPYDLPFHLHTTRPLFIGCMKLTDFLTSNRKIKKMDHSLTGMIRQTFYYAIDLQGSHIPTKAEMLSSADMLMWHAIISGSVLLNTSNPAVHSVISAINEHFIDPDFDVNDYIDQTGYSKNHFRKMFQAETGSSPITFIQTRRLDNAKRLMRENSGLSIGEIALQSGFSDVHYFSRLFRKNFDMTPSEYMQKEAGR